ncbi:unnamed protein product, partial [Aphanomyces euteiches]
MARDTKYQSVVTEKDQRRKDYAKSPLETEGFISRWLYLWADPLMKLVITTTFEPKYNATKSIFWAIAREFGLEVVVIGALQFVAMVLSLYGPIVLNGVVSSIEQSSPDFKTLATPIVSLFFVKIVQAILQTQMDLKNELLFAKVTGVLQNLLYKKTLRLSATSRQTKSTGEIANLFTSDMWTVVSLSLSVNQVWIIPLQVTALMYFLWKQLNWAMFAGFAIMIISFFLTRQFSSKLKFNWRVLMAKKDTRMKLTNEVFGSMQIIKLNAWEERYYSKLCDLCADELTSFWTQIWIAVGLTAMNNIAPVALTTISFAYYVLVLKQPLTAAK